MSPVLRNDWEFANVADLVGIFWAWRKQWLGLGQAARHQGQVDTRLHIVMKGAMP